MRYALVSFNGEPPHLVFVERDGRVTIHTGSPEADEREQRFIDKLGAKTIEHAVGSGYSYSDFEFGEYTGAAKERVDQIIAELGKRAEGEQ